MIVIKQKHKVTFKTIQDEKNLQKVEFANEQRRQINFASEQVAGFPFNAQLLYPEYDELDTVEKKDNLIEKLTR